MELIESIACYSGSIRNKIKRVLTSDVKTIIATLVQNPSFVSCVDIDLLNELIDMDIFYEKLTSGLTDIIPLLINGQIQNESLKEAARKANINVDSQPTCITTKDAEEYKVIINKISSRCTDYYIATLPKIQGLLSNTIVGHQGAPIENLMMNFWIYMRKSISQKLYDNGFLNDNIPQNGSSTIFYENGIDYF